MSDPKGEETPHPDPTPEDDLPLDFSDPQEDVFGGDPVEQGGSHHERGPLSMLGIGASSEDFQFSGPAEELDFTEPAEFAFPSGQPAHETSPAESSAELPAEEHGGVEDLLGIGDAAESEPAADEAVADDAEAEGEAAADLDMADSEEAEEAEKKPKRELPAWVHALEWSMVGFLAIGALVALFASIVWLKDAKQVTLILHISCGLMLLLIPYSLWRSARHWTTPGITALYTVLSALSVALLIGGTWAEGVELSHYGWQFNRADVAAGTPRPAVQPPPPLGSVK